MNHANAISEQREWGLNQYFALIGLVFIVYQGIGWIGWLADGPEQLTKYRNPETVSWYICRAFEILAVVTLIYVIVHIRKQWKLENGIPFDALFCIACFSLYWQDPLANFFAPLFIWSHNWINLNDWLGYLPFSPNPDPGRTAEPIIGDGLNYLAGWLVFAMMVNGMMDKWKQWFPRSTNANLVCVAFVMGGIVDILLEAPMYYFDAWQFPGQPDIGLWADTGHKFPITEMFSGAIMFSLASGIRYFRNQDGLRFVERGMDHYSTGTRKLVTTLSMIGILNTAFLLDNMMYMFAGIYSGPYKDMPAHVVGGVCDAPGFEGTRFGPCPGAEGYKQPLPGSLPGDEPWNEDKWLNGPKQCEVCELKMIGHIPVVDGELRPDLLEGQPPEVRWSLE